MTHCFMTGRPPTCSDSTDVPVVTSIGKLQTTLQSHAGLQGDHLVDRRRSTRVSPYNAVGNDAAASQLLHSLPQATPSVPSPRCRRRRLSPLHSMKRSRAAGALYIVNKMCVDVVFSIFPRGTKDTYSQVSRHWSVTGQSSINRSRTFRIDPSEKIG